MFALFLRDQNNELVLKITQILKIDIQQQEGFAPIGKVHVLRAENWQAEFKPEMIFELVDEGDGHAHQEILLCGRYCGHLPAQLGVEIIILKPRAITADVMKEIIEPFNGERSPYFKHIEDSGYTYPIETLPVFVDYNRSSGQYAINHILNGYYQELSIHNLLHQTKINQFITKEPYKQAKLQLEASWQSHAFDVVDVGEVLRHQSGEISTLTFDSLAEAWPKDGQSIGNGMFTVISSKIKAKKKRINVSFDNKKKEIKLLLATCIPELVLAWSQKITYQESFAADVSLPVASHDGPTLFQEFRLDISDFLALYSGESFFESECGKKAILHGMKMMKIRIAASHRNRRLTLTIPYESLRNISTFHCLRIHDPRLINGQFSGKVIAYRIFLSQGSLWVSVTLAAASDYFMSFLKSWEKLDHSIAVNQINANPVCSVQSLFPYVEVQNTATQQLESLKRSGDLNVDSTVIKIHLNADEWRKKRLVKRCFTLA